MTNRTPLGPNLIAQLRDWQEQHQVAYLTALPDSWLLAAAPGAGKTIATLSIARHLLEDGIVEKVVVIAPTKDVTRNWIRDAELVGIALYDAYRGPIHGPVSFTASCTPIRRLTRCGRGTCHIRVRSSASCRFR